MQQMCCDVVRGSPNPFVDALPGFLLPDAASQARSPMLEERLRALAEAVGARVGRRRRLSGVVNDGEIRSHRDILTALSSTASTSRASAYYWATVREFLSADPSLVLGRLTEANQFDLDEEQKRAWEEEIRILRGALRDLPGTIYLEFDVPRLGSRIDAVFIAGPAIFPIEFKCGEDKYHLADYNQAWDYALDLKNFHLASHAAPILPILVASQAPASDPSWQQPHEDEVRPPHRCRAVDLKSVIESGLACVSGDPIDGRAWGTAPYQPTPTIIEAARALYARHTVEAISRHDAGARNLGVTSAAVEEIIERSRARHEKAVVFLTGVPGAGKTLVGLNVATRRRDAGEARAVFLSGNGPLVTVLQEALTRDELVRLGHRVRKGVIRQRVKPFIQNVHHFRDDGIRDPSAAPFDHVVIFDEAQRAWDSKKTADFMKRRKKIPDFNQSEPAFLISYLDRHDTWAVIICLVGGGQEIHTGEAGIAEWLDAVRLTFDQAFHGTEVELDLTTTTIDEKGLPHRSPSRTKVRIPKGVADGQKLRVPGQGGKGARGGRNGDLYLDISVAPHPVFRVDGADLYVDLPLAPWEAVLGTSVQLPTPAGTVNLKVPPATQAGQRLRLAGRGLARPGTAAGSLYAIVQIVVPTVLDDAQRALYRQLAQNSTFNPRAHFGEEGNP